MPSSPKAGASRIERAGDLMTALHHVPDPRDRRGVRHRLAGMLAVAVCAVLAGARSFAAIGEWASDLNTEQVGRLGLERAPTESTLRTLFARIDAAGLDAALAVFAWCRIRHLEGRRPVAIDGKTVRGARTATGAPTASDRRFGSCHWRRGGPARREREVERGPSRAGPARRLRPG